MHEFPRSCLKGTLTLLESCVKCDFHFGISGLKPVDAFETTVIEKYYLISFFQTLRPDTPKWWPPSPFFETDQSVRLGKKSLGQNNTEGDSSDTVISKHLDDNVHEANLTFYTRLCESRLVAPRRYTSERFSHKGCSLYKACVI
ncbi:hypothetical protein BCR37DRAFT_377720, partial [Protomyces lactucae-debilis]